MRVPVKYSCPRPLVDVSDKPCDCGDMKSVASSDSSDSKCWHERWV